MRTLSFKSAQVHNAGTKRHLKPHRIKKQELNIRPCSTAIIYPGIFTPINHLMPQSQSRDLHYESLKDRVQLDDMHSNAGQACTNTKVPRSRQRNGSVVAASTGCKNRGAGGQMQQPACLCGLCFEDQLCCPIEKVETCNLQQWEDWGQ